MLVTARNRMGSAEVVRQSYAGQLLQTFRFNLEDQSPGIYLVRIEGQNGLLTTRRMVIAR